jgi:two-component system cell cycle sensor histidine kinase/response regulator CckA
MHLARGEGKKKSDTPKVSVWRQALPRTSLLLFFLLVTVVAVLSGVFFQTHMLRHQETTIASLQAIADLKVGQIVQWYNAYRDQGDALDRNPAVGRWLADFLHNPGRTDRRREILTWMANLKALYDFEDILLISADGKSILALNPERGGLGTFGKENLAVAVRTAKVFMSDLHRASHPPDIHMDLYVPVRDEPGMTGARPNVAGVLMFRISPYLHLFPLLRSWPMVSTTAESYLMRREGGDALFLSDVRQVPDAPLNLRRPLSAPCLPAALAVLGMEGFIHGVNYRGRPVLAVMRPVTGTPWSLVSEMEEAEAMASVRLTGIMLLVACLSLIVVSGLAFVFVWYRKTRELLRAGERADAERQALTRHYLNLSKYANDIILLADEKLRVIEANDRALAAYGYERDAILARCLADFLPRHLQGSLEGMIRRVDRERSLMYETLHQRHDGNLFPVEVSLRRIGESGLNYYQAIVRDITERREQQRLFERYQVLSRYARDIILFLRPDGRIIEANAAAEKAYGYDRDQLATMTVADLRASYAVSSICGHLAEANAQGITFETVHRHRDGSLFPVEVSSSGVTIGEDRVLVSIVRDTTERTQAARALEASEKNLRQVIDLVPHAVYARDKTGRLILFNRRFAEWVGVPGDALLTGEEHGWLGGAERADVSRRDDRQVIETGETVKIAEETWIDRDGVSRILQTIKVPFTPAGSSERAVLCISIDITEIKQLQEQLAQAQKMEGVGRLAGGIAHDFNNLLQVIIGFNDILMGRLDEQHPGRRDAQEVSRAAKRASELTRQLLAYSRKQLLVSQVVDLNRIVEAVSSEVTPQLGDHIEFVKQLDPALRPVNVDPDQIEQVLLHLVSNARDAMPTGGRLTIQTKPFTVSASDVQQMTEARVGSYVCLSVSDTGLGMSQVSIDHLFEPFYSTKSQDPGAGLGLAMVHGIIKQHGGWIQVYSQDGMGTTIKVFLLVADRDVVDPEPSMPVENGNGSAGSVRILVVEDEDMVRQFAMRVLRERGYEVFGAKTARDALAVFEEQSGSFHVVFSDVVLPDINGLDLVRQLRPKQPQMRFLLTSGYMDEKSRWPEIQREGIRFIQKPYPSRELLSVLQSVINEGPGQPVAATESPS